MPRNFCTGCVFWKRISSAYCTDYSFWYCSKFSEHLLTNRRELCGGKYKKTAV